MSKRRVSVLDKIKNDFLELEKDNDRPETFKDTLKDLAENSSLHGIPKIVHSRQIVVKVLWCLLVLVAFGVFTVQLYQLFKTFYSYPSQTSVSLEFSPIAFPSITLCNMNPVRKSQIYKANELQLFLHSQSNNLLNTAFRRKRETDEKKSKMPMENSDTTYDQKIKIHRITLSETETKPSVEIDNEQTTASNTEQSFDFHDKSAFIDYKNSERPDFKQVNKDNIEDLFLDIGKETHNTEFENSLKSVNIMKASRDGGFSDFPIDEVYENNGNMYERLPTKPNKHEQKGIRRRKREAIESSNSVPLYDSLSDFMSISPVTMEMYSLFEADATEPPSFASISPTATSVFQYSTADVSPSAFVLQSLISPEVSQSTEELTGSSAVFPTPQISDFATALSYLNTFNSVFSNQPSSSIYPTSTGEGSSYPWSYWYSSSSYYYYYDWASWFNYMYDYEYGSSWNSWNDYSGSLFFYDQLVSSKDEWDERMDNFRQIFKNQSLKMRNEIGHQKEDMILSATFAGRVQNVSQFKTFMSTEYGNCYTIASPKYVAWRSGPAHGIKLTLNLELDEYIENFSPGYGIRIVFHEPGTYPLPSHDGITLSPATETNIGLRMVRIKRLGEPHGDCIDGTEFEARYDKKYSISACYEFCRIHKAMQECNCIPVEAPDDVQLNSTLHSVCNESKITVKKCLLDVDVLFDNGAIDCDCRGPCKETVYSKTMSSTYWPADDYLGCTGNKKGHVCRVVISNIETAVAITPIGDAPTYVNGNNISEPATQAILLADICEKKNTTSFWADVCYNFKSMNYWELDKYRYNFLRVLVYYEDLNYESITEEPMYESVRFLSDIGGAMGLFLGASVLSFVEGIQLILEIFLYIKHKGDKKNRVIDLKK